MPGDEVHEEAGASDDSAPHTRGRTGPRHAAPRKPLLTRFHVPAGKAVALAAMPSAVLMGMGLTPQLASAKPLPKNPFKGDACVSAPDKEETEAEKQDRKDRAEKLKRDLKREQAKRKKAAQEAAEGAGDGKSAGGSGGAGDAEDGATPESPANPSEGSGGSGGSGSGGESSEKPAPPSSEPGDGSGDSEDEKNPWYDPLGVGKKLDDAFKPKDTSQDESDDEKKAEKPADEESGTPSSGADSGSGSGDTAGKGSTADEPSSGEKAGDGSGSGSDSGSSALKDAKSKEKAAKEAAAKEKAKAEKAAKEAKKRGESEDKKDKDEGVSKKDGTARDYDAAKDAGKPYPCPEKTDVEGKGEQTPAQVPNQPWNLEASSLTLNGLDYEGVVNITMPNGKTKQALKFTADTLDIGDLHQTVKGPNGTTYHVQAAEGSTSTIRGGKVTMYTEELKGNLFGLIPITFSPETPPPINVPFAYFTKVTVKQAGQFGGNLTVPGLHQYVAK